MMNRATFPGAVLRARPLGYLEMADEKGSDQKILAVPVDDPRYDSTATSTTCRAIACARSSTSSGSTRSSRASTPKVDGWHGMDETHALIDRGDQGVPRSSAFPTAADAAALAARSRLGGRAQAPPRPTLFFSSARSAR
jgi:hypothetical protein